MSKEQSSYNILIGKLDEFIRKYYKNQLFRGLIYAIGVTAVFYLSVVLLEYFAHFGTGVRKVLFYSFILINLGILIRWVLIPLSKLFRLGRVISHEQASNIIGSHFVNVKDKLLNTLQLQHQAQQISTDLIQASVNQKITELRPIPFTAAIDLGENRKYLKYAIIPLIIIGAMMFSAPSVLKDGTTRLIDHDTFYEKMAPFSFNIQNDELKAVRNDDFELQLKLTGEELPEKVYIRVSGNDYVLNKEDKTTFHHLFRNVQEDIAFKFMADGYESGEYVLSALPSPVVLDFEVGLEYPAYLQKKNEKLENTGDLIVPMGTKINWTFYTKDTRTLKLSFNDTSFQAAINDNNLFTYSKHFLKSANYTINTANEFIDGRDPIAYSINVIPDHYPGIQVEKFQDSLSSRKFYFKGAVKDDYGFKNLTFNYKMTGKTDSKWISKSLPVKNSSTHDQFYHYWDVGQLNIKAGDQVEYYFEVWDNDGINGSKSTRTRPMFYKAPTLDEIEENTGKRNDEIKEKMEESLMEARQIQKELEDINKKMLEKKKLGWEEKKKVEDLLERQKELEKKINQIQQQNEQNMREEEEFTETDQRIMEKHTQLREMFEQLMSDEMKEMYKELQELMEEMNKDQLKEKLEEIKHSNKDLEKELDRSLELFKQMEFFDKYEKTMEKLEELKEKQEKLAKETEESKKSDSEELGKKQEELNKEFEKIQEDMKDLEKKNENLEFPNDMKNLDKEQQDINKEMQESKESLDQKKNKNASGSQKKAAQKMEDMQEKMQQAMDSMMEQQQGEDYRNLRQILENLVKLSFDQEELINTLGDIRPNDPQYGLVNQKQRKLKDDAQLIEDSLLALSKRVPQIESVVNKEINTININMEKAMEFLADRRTMENARQAGTKQQYAMTSINNLALLLDEALRKMQEQMAQQQQKKSGKPSNCQKPGSGMGGMKKPQNIGDMMNMQKQLSDRIKKLKEGGQGGKMSKELAKTAAEQEALRQQLRKLSQELDEKGGGGKGNLDQLQKLMEENEEDLVNKNISQETLDRQKEILTRLLEAEKAERTRGEEEKRESREVKNEDFGNPEEFFEYKRLKEKEVELLKTVPPTLKTYYKRKVNEYFNNFEE